MRTFFPHLPPNPLIPQPSTLPPSPAPANNGQQWHAERQPPLEHQQQHRRGSALRPHDAAHRAAGHRQVPRRDVREDDQRERRQFERDGGLHVREPVGQDNRRRQPSEGQGPRGMTTQKQKTGGYIESSRAVHVLFALFSSVRRVLFSDRELSAGLVLASSRYDEARRLRSNFCAFALSSARFPCYNILLHVCRLFYFVLFLSVGFYDDTDVYAPGQKPEDLEGAAHEPGREGR